MLPFPDLLNHLMLGTARREPAPALAEWIERLQATEPGADTAEQLLAAVALRERSHRLVPPTPLADDGLSKPAPPETTAPAPPRLARGLELMLGETYADLLPEGIATVLDGNYHVPAHHLPALHQRAAALLDADPELADRYLQAGGQRALWLARHHPNWATLLPDYDYAAAYAATEQPAPRAQLLARWRRQHPAAARAALTAEWNTLSPRNQEVLLGGMTVNLSPADYPWLRAALKPKRKGVRRALTRLLAHAREPQTLADLRQMARSEKTLDPYGKPKTPETLRQWLLELLPPTDWEGISGQTLHDFAATLPKLELRSLGRAVRDLGDDAERATFLQWLLTTEPAGFPADLAQVIGRGLPDESFERILSSQLGRRAQNVLRPGGLARYVVLGRRSPWSEALTRAVVEQLLDDTCGHHIDYRRSRSLSADWQAAIPLVSVAAFPWLRRQLHSFTERYDAFGKLATRLLQATHFRRELLK